MFREILGASLSETGSKNSSRKIHIWLHLGTNFGSHLGTHLGAHFGLSWGLILDPMWSPKHHRYEARHGTQTEPKNSTHTHAQTARRIEPNAAWVDEWRRGG